MQLVHAIMAGDIRIFDLPAKSIERLRFALSIPNPEYERRRQFGKSTKDIPDSFECLIEYPNGCVAVPRGTIYDIKALLLRDEVKLTFEDHRTLGDPISVAQEPSLRPYQAEALSAMTVDPQGVVVMPCGSGKSRLGVAAIGRLQRKTVVLVHTEDLLRQWVDEVWNLLGLRAGTIQNGKFTDGPVVVAMIRTSLSLLAQNPNLFDSFGICICDEAHRSPAETHKLVLPQVRAKYRFGLTATPEREDKQDRVIGWTFGKRLFEIDSRTLVKLGYLMMPSIEIVDTLFQFSSSTKDDLRRMQELQTALVHDQTRNTLVADRAVQEVRAGEFVALLTNHREHCRILGRMIFERGVEPTVLTAEGSSKASKKRREDAIQGMRDGKIPILIATSLLDEGISINRLSRVLLALPQKAKGGTQQRTGRSMRLFEGKNPKIIDFVDRNVETLVRRFKERMKVYREIGFLGTD